MNERFFAKPLLINKPRGPTSHDIVAHVRNVTGIKCVGHAGTLDPFAEGLLIVLVGRPFTKQQNMFLAFDKDYTATITLGATSTTDDGEGSIMPFPDPTHPTKKTIAHALRRFVGTQTQMPPLYSAKKINGTPAYRLARRGHIPALLPHTVTIFSIEMLSFQWPCLRIALTVSSGTYIRSIARDFGYTLGCGAYLTQLIRTRIGPYCLKDALDLENLVVFHKE